MAKTGSEFLRTMGTKAKDGTLKSVYRDWKWIWRFTRRHWGRVIAYTLFGIVGSALALVAGVLGKYMIDAIMVMDLSRLALYCGLTVLSAVLGVAFESLTARFSARLSIDMLRDVQSQVFSDVMAARWSDISAYPSGELLNRFSTDINTVSGCAVSWVPGLIIQGFTVLATLGVIMYYDPIMALIGCASTPLMFLASRSLLRKQHGHNKKMRQVSGELSAFQSEAFRNMDTVKSFGVEPQMEQRLEQRQDAYRETVLAHNSFAIRTNIWLTAMATAVQYAAIGYCLWRLWRGDILFGTMTLFLQQRSSLANAFSSLVGLVPTALSGSVAAERLQELCDLPRETAGECPPVRGKCRVEFQNVSAGYGEARIVNGANLTVPAGKVVALVGPSGEGKTTLLRLLLGLIPPQEGEVFLEDETGERYPIGPDTRSLFTYVPQGNTMIAGTVAENLRLARADATDDELIQALTDACAWEFVRELPQGLNSPIGENGKGLSEGQAQRLAIARALTRNAPVVLLDEVTSALDGETEKKVLDHLCHRGVTTLVTTHRPSVLELCSAVYQVSQGSVTPLKS